MEKITGEGRQKCRCWLREEYEGREDTDPSFECDDGDGGDGDGYGGDADPPSEGKIAVFCSNM